VRELLIRKLTVVGKFFEFLLDVCRCLFRRPIRLGLFMEEIEHLGVNSIPIIVLASLSIGMIFALQMVYMLQPYQAEIGVGWAVAVAMGRELAPVITTLMLIAKNGSAMAAELGTMSVTEQIDAMESMSVLPVHYLVVPRVFASVVVFPFLTMLSNVVGAFGAFMIATRVYSIDPASYTSYMFSNLNPRDVYSGLIKSAVMGFLVATISTYYGLNVTQGAKGVGDGATKAVVVSSVAILVADYVMATLMMMFLFV
jgi:phospholipid/cholesterol/gamma-HCH transport system permease protein